MTRSIAAGFIAMLVLGISLSVGSDAQAQGVRRPTVSPYLNLLRRDATPAENYYNLVRPEQQFRQSLLQQNREIQQLRRQQTAAPQTQSPTSTGPTAIPGTGHRTYFQSYSHYYAFPVPSRIR